MITRVISGGQTGADQAGLRAAKRLGIPTGGMMPKGWRTESVPRPEFRELYGMVESQYAGYEHRTRWNVNKSDGTIIFARLGETGLIIDAGSILTQSYCTQLDKPQHLVDLGRPVTASVAAAARDFLMQLEIVNVAGNRESRSPGIGELVERFLLDVLPLARQTAPAVPPSHST